MGERQISRLKRELGFLQFEGYMKPKEDSLGFVRAEAEHWPPPTEKKQRKLVFVECGKPAESQLHQIRPSR